MARASSWRSEMASVRLASRPAAGGGVGGDAGESNSRSSEGLLRIVLQAFPPQGFSFRRPAGGDEGDGTSRWVFGGRYRRLPAAPRLRWRPAAPRRGEGGRRDAHGLGRESEFAIVGAYSVAAFLRGSRPTSACYPVTFPPVDTFRPHGRRCAHGSTNARCGKGARALTWSGAGRGPPGGPPRARAACGACRSASRRGPRPAPPWRARRAGAGQGGRA